MTKQNLRSKVGGFTLIELMIAVAIVGILARIAYPIYTQSVRKAHRADAKTALLDLAQREERYMSTANGYTDTATALGYNTGTTVTQAAPMSIVSGGTTYYTMSVVVTAATATSPITYTATATPAGNQVNDTACPSFTLDSKGNQGPAATATTCW